METPYDWTTLSLFCALALLFLQRSIGTPVPGDRAILYLPPALACMAANRLGNGGHDAIAITIIVVGISYALLVLKPWIQWR